MPPFNCELVDLRALVAVADGKSFLRAAELLNLSQPALSRRIQKLEASIGTRLLERTTRSVRLTPAGQEILPLLKRLLEEMDGSLLGMIALGERQAGRLTVASIPSATVRFLPEFAPSGSLSARIGKRGAFPRRSAVLPKFHSRQILAIIAFRLTNDLQFSEAIQKFVSCIFRLRRLCRRRGNHQGYIGVAANRA